MHEITGRKSTALQTLGQADEQDTLSNWLDAYFAVEVTTAASSRAVQRRDLTRFVAFVLAAEGHDQASGLDRAAVAGVLRPDARPDHRASENLRQVDPPTETLPSSATRWRT